MLLGGRRKTETWVHSFSVGSETRKYKGFTIYRITSIVFPRSHPEGLTRVTLWKRFSEVKKLHKELVRRHRERHLPGTVPTLADQSYFKRFDPAVIEERKRYILQLLEFAGQEPLLYRSHAFLNFFTRGIAVPEKEAGNDEPAEERGAGKRQNGTGGDGGGNIETIRKQLGIGQQDELSLIDPSRDGRDGQDGSTGTDGSCTSGDEEVDEVDAIDCQSVAPAPSREGSLIDSMISETGSMETGRAETMATEDYLVAAGMVFSKAVEAEANGDYERAFEQYKAGIDRLLSGAKDDTNETRRKIAKEKSCKYVAKAEEIYERFLEEQSLGSCADDRLMGPLTYDDPSSPIQLLERPLNYLSRYKVVKVIGTVMQVQDVTDKKFYIMKSIRRPVAPGGGGLPFPSAAVFPPDVPYMVPLIAYFQATDGGIFLLLRLVCAGKLWDFIRSYRKPESYCPSPVENDFTVEESDGEGGGNEVESKQGKGSETDGAQRRVEPNCSGYDSGFLELVNEYSNGGGGGVEASDGNSPSAADQNDGTDEVAEEVLPDEEEEENGPVGKPDEEPELVIPSFDALSKDMDVRELLSCSQRLLKAVTQTLEESDEHSNSSAQISAVPASSLETAAAAAPGEGGQESRKSHSSQLGLARMSSISEPVDELTPDLLPEGSVRRWISELVIAVDSLHFNGIVCGDLTMDNLLLGPEGQLMLTYFHRRGESYFCQPGGAHPVAPKQSAIRALYVAPERPLEPRSDFWSIGVIMFEMLTKRKFVSCHPSGVFCYHEVQYPEGVELSMEARELLEGLLQPDVERRLDFKQIIASAFFRTVDWSEVKRRGVSANHP
uniref:ribosomal protein S6 kinase delta-1 n=1 Tax=Anopheles coluzzii TaxID=1518534 RepID=UPI0020FFDA22|nr:ribosomal protein S6 kinase delta-1 [Anopheles coluzzii]